MEFIPRRSPWSWVELNPGNSQVLRQKIKELHQEHFFPADAIARILHIDEGWVAGILRELERMPAGRLSCSERKGNLP